VTGILNYCAVSQPLLKELTLKEAESALPVWAPPDALPFI
jgi:hypothetical protein